MVLPRCGWWCTCRHAVQHPPPAQLRVVHTMAVDSSSACPCSIRLSPAKLWALQAEVLGEIEDRLVGYLQKGTGAFAVVHFCCRLLETGGPLHAVGRLQTPNRRC